MKVSRLFPAQATLEEQANMFREIMMISRDIVEQQVGDGDADPAGKSFRIEFSGENSKPG